MAELTLTKGSVEVSVLFDMVQIQIHCGDEYVAQSAYDELVELLKIGKGLTLCLAQPERNIGER